MAPKVQFGVTSWGAAVKNKLDSVGGRLDRGLTLARYVPCLLAAPSVHNTTKVNTPLSKVTNLLPGLVCWPQAGLVSVRYPHSRQQSHDKSQGKPSPQAFIRAGIGMLLLIRETWKIMDHTGMVATVAGFNCHTSFVCFFPIGEEQPILTGSSIVSSQ